MIMENHYHNVVVRSDAASDVALENTMSAHSRDCHDLLCGSNVSEAIALANPDPFEQGVWKLPYLHRRCHYKRTASADALRRQHD